jgi:hypothetical protein
MGLVTDDVRDFGALLGVEKKTWETGDRSKRKE